MKKVATIAALALMAQQASAVCGTSSNWVATAASITAVGDAGNSNAAITGVDATWLTCASLKTSGNSCCPKTDIATFQTKADALVDTLETAVTTRDQYILDRRGDVLNVRDSIASIESSLESLGADNASVSATLEAFTGAYESAITAFTEDFDALKAAFIQFQKDRVTCFNALVQGQVSIWCAACDEGFATLGLDDATDTVTFGTTFEGYLANACSAYVASAVEQSSILSLYAVSDLFAALASALDKIVNGDAEAGVTELTEFITDFNAITIPTNVLHREATAPTTCTTTDCDWATTLLSTGALDTNTATVGGVVASSRRLQEIPTGRMLQMNVNPGTEAAGITVAFPENPGNVDNDQNSAVRNGAIACAITALAALF